MKWINKNLKTLSLIVVLFGIMWVVCAPIILTQTNFSIVDFSDSENNTGQIGDTIGGITAPVVGLISVILLYFALIKQVESNSASVHDANFRIIYEELSKLRSSLDEYTFQKKSGTEAITSFASHIGSTYLLGQLTEEYYKPLRKFALLINSFNKIFYLLDNLKTSDQYNDFLSKELHNIFSTYFADGNNIIQQDWSVSEMELSNMSKGKMYIIKKDCGLILENIINRNPITKI